MDIEGYEEHATDAPAGQLRIFVAAEVVAFLRVEARDGNRNRKHVAKVDQILRRLRRDGLQGVNNTEQFKPEGKFPSGRKGGGDVTVYVAKSDQVRVYGGLIKTKNGTVFLFREATAKKDNKADQALLKRVAKALGEKSDELR